MLYRELSGQGITTEYVSNPHNLLHILFTTQTISTISTTSRQEIRDFKFRSDERIGLEVEFLNGRVSNVFLSYSLFLYLIDLTT